MIKSAFFKLILIALTLINIPGQAQIKSWTHFRGNNLDGISSTKNAPVKWTSDSNVVWKTVIHDKGWSSPVVYNDQIWMTTAKQEGEKMYAVCVNYKTGEIIHDILLFEPDSIYRKHGLNSFATPTPAIEQGYMYAHFGRYGTACIDTQNGNIKWKRSDIEFVDVQGPGSSLFIYKNSLIVHCEGIDIQIILALDKSTGQTVWRTERPKEIYDKIPPIGKKAYITPIIINVNGQEQLISNGSAACFAYDPNTGKEIWRVVGGIDSTISMPFSEGELVFFYTGFMVDETNEKYVELMAVDPSGKGDIGETNVIWRMRTPILQLLTPLVKDGLIYTIDTKSTLMCIEAKTGDIIWSKRVRGKYNSSPIYAAGKIYFSSTNGKVIVINEGMELEIIAENKLEGEIWTTPIILDGNILIRTSKYLYKIGT